MIMERMEGTDHEVTPQETLSIARTKPITIQNRSAGSGHGRNEPITIQNRSAGSGHGRNDVGRLLLPPNRSTADPPNSPSALRPDHNSLSPAGSVVYHDHPSPKLAQSGASSSAPGLDFYMSPDQETQLPDLSTRDQSRTSSSSVIEKVPDARVILATGGYDRNIRLWDLQTGINYRTIRNRGSHVNKLMITGTRNKRFIAAAGNPDIHFYELNTMRNEPVTSYHGHEDNVTSMDFHRSGNWMVSSSEDKTVRFWDLRDPSECHHFLCPDPVNSVKLHPNEVEIFCAGEQGVISVLDLRRNICSFELRTGRTDRNTSAAAIKSMDIRWNGTLLVATNTDGMCFVWKLRSGGQMNTRCEFFTRIQAHGTYITKCCFSPELSQRNLFATCSADKTLKLWKVESADVTLDRTLIGHKKWVWDCAFSRDGTNLISSSSDSTTRLWQVSTGNILQTYHVKELYSGAMNCCAFDDTDPLGNQIPVSKPQS